MRRRLVPFLASLLVPGLGQLFSGRVARAVLMASLFYGLELVNSLLAPYWMGFSFHTYVTGWFGIRLLRLLIALDAWLVGNTRGVTGPPLYALFLTVFVGLPRLVMMWGVTHNRVPMQLYNIQSDAMEPTVRVGEVIVVDTTRRQPLQLDQLAVLSTSDGVTVSRVVSIGEDLVRLQLGQLVRSGHPVKEDYLKEPNTLGMLDTVVPRGQIFVLSDNRTSPNCRDSRMLGPIPTESVRARPLFIFWSPDHSRIGKTLEPG